MSGSFDYSQASLHTFFAESGEVIMDVVEDVFSHDGILLKRRRRQQSGVFEMRANVFLVNYAFNDVDQLVPRLGAWRRRRRRRRRIIGYYGADATICQAHLSFSLRTLDKGGEYLSLGPGLGHPVDPDVRAGDGDVVVGHL